MRTSAIVVLTPAEMTRLEDIAAAELRDTDQQATFFVKRALAAADPVPDHTSQPNSEQAVAR